MFRLTERQAIAASVTWIILSVFLNWIMNTSAWRYDAGKIFAIAMSVPVTMFAFLYAQHWIFPNPADKGNEIIAAFGIEVESWPPHQAEIALAILRDVVSCSLDAEEAEEMIGDLAVYQLNRLVETIKKLEAAIK